MEQPIAHLIEDPNNFNPSMSHLALKSIEKIINDNNLTNYKYLLQQYGFKEESDCLAAITPLGKVTNTNLGPYVDGDGYILIMKLASFAYRLGMFVSVEIMYHDDVDISNLIKRIQKVLEPHKRDATIARIDWQFVVKHDLCEIMSYNTDIVKLHQEAYPYVTPDIDTYIDTYRESNASILFLIGPPGTGKTKFIRYLLQRWALNKINTIGDNSHFTVMYSNSQEAFEHDQLFTRFLSYKYTALILEDIDFNLRSRARGDNAFMHKLLNASDGLISLNGKKIIITTNLHSEQSTDEALLRPGRAYDVLKTRYLCKDEADNLAKVLGTPFTITKENNQYSLAEIYNNKIGISHEKLGLAK